MPVTRDFARMSDDELTPYLILGDDGAVKEFTKRYSRLARHLMGVSRDNLRSQGEDTEWFSDVVVNAATEKVLLLVLEALAPPSLELGGRRAELRRELIRSDFGGLMPLARSRTGGKTLRGLVILAVQHVALFLFEQATTGG